MKILCGRRDDILRDKQNYEADKARRKAAYQQKYARYETDRAQIAAGVENVLRTKLSGINLDMEIRVEERYGDTLEVKVSDERNPHDDSKALAWSWEVKINPRGEIQKESSSWSGLNATTPQHIEYLQELLKAVTTLNDIDWNTLLNVELPNLRDYVGNDRNPDYETPDRDFDAELLDATLQDLVGAYEAVIGSGYKYYNTSATCAYQIVKESGTQYTVIEMLYKNGQVEGRDSMPYRIRKSTLKDVIDTPIKTIEL